MIKEVLQQLEPLDAQIDALCSSADDAEMTDTTTHAAELAELSAMHCHAAILGKSIYTGAIDLAKAVRLYEGE